MNRTLTAPQERLMAEARRWVAAAREPDFLAALGALTSDPGMPAEYLLGWVNSMLRDMISLADFLLEVQ